MIGHLDKDRKNCSFNGGAFMTGHLDKDRKECSIHGGVFTTGHLDKDWKKCSFHGGQCGDVFLIQDGNMEDVLRLIIFFQVKYILSNSLEIYIFAYQFNCYRVTENVTKLSKL